MASSKIHTTSGSPLREGFLQAVGPSVVGGFGDDASLIDWLEVWRHDDYLETFPFPPPKSTIDSSPEFLSSPTILVDDDITPKHQVVQPSPIPTQPLHTNPAAIHLPPAYFQQQQYQQQHYLQTTAVKHQHYHLPPQPYPQHLDSQSYHQPQYHPQQPPHQYQQQQQQEYLHIKQENTSSSSSYEPTSTYAVPPTGYIPQTLPNYEGGYAIPNSFDPLGSSYLPSSTTSSNPPHSSSSGPQPPQFSAIPDQEIVDLKEFFLQEIEIQNQRRAQYQHALGLLQPSSTEASASSIKDDHPHEGKVAEEVARTVPTIKRDRFEPVVEQKEPPTKHTSLTQTTLQASSDPPNLKLLDPPEHPFPKYAQRNRPVTPIPRVEIENLAYPPSVDLTTLGIYVQVLCTDMTPLSGFVADSSPGSNTMFEWPRLIFPISPDASRNRGARVHPGEQKYITFQVKTQHPNAITSTISQIPPKTTSIFLFDHSKWFPSPEISIISNPVVEINTETEIHVYGQWFISHDEESSNLGRLRITILDMDGLEQKVSQVNAKGNHHFSFVHTWTQPCTVWVQVHNEFKHRSSFKTRQSPRRTHQSTILVVPNREAYFNWVHGSTANSVPSGAPSSAASSSAPSSRSPNPPRQQGDSSHPPQSQSQQQPPHHRCSTTSTSSSSSEVEDDSNKKHCPLKMTPLHHSARLGDVTEVKSLLRAGQDPFAVDLLGQTPLHLATIFGQAEVLRTIISHLKEKKVRQRLIRVRDLTGMTAFHRACFYPQADKAFEMAKNILQVESDAHFPYVGELNFTPLHASLLSGHQHISSILLDSLRNGKASFSQPSIDGHSLFHLAAISNSAEIIPRLARLTHIDSLDYNGESALFLALRSRSPKMVSSLLQLGPSLRLLNTANENLLDIAHPDHLPMLLRFSGLALPQLPVLSLPFDPVSDQRVRLVGSAIVHLTKTQNSVPERPNSFGRRNRSAPDFQDLIKSSLLDDETTTLPLDIHIDEDLLKDSLFQEPTTPESPKISSPSHRSRRRGSHDQTSTFSHKRTVSTDSKNQPPDLIVIPSLFSMLTLSPRAKKDKKEKKKSLKKHLFGTKSKATPQLLTRQN